MLDSLFDLLTAQYAVVTAIRYYALAKIFELLDDGMQEKIRENNICKIDEKKINEIEKRIEKGEVDGIEFATDMIAIVACIMHAFNTIGLKDIVDAVMQLTAIEQRSSSQ